MTDLDRAHDALYSLDSGCDRETWHKIGRAAIAAGVSVEVIDKWSSTAGNYAGERDVRAAFRTIKPEGGTGAGTLFRLAREAGWIDAGAHQQSTVQTPYKQHAKHVAPPRTPARGMGLHDVWSRFEAATAQHPYVAQKQAAGIPLDNLRVVPSNDPLMIQGEPMAGALVVPVIRADGSMSSLQFIALPDVAKRLKAQKKSGKLNLPNHQMQGWHTVGELAPGHVIYIVEGIGQAWACWQATGAAAVSCCGWGRVRSVTAELRQRDPAATLVLCPDVGKEDEAEKIAQEFNAAVAKMPEGWPQNSDVGDLALQDRDALIALLESASQPPKPALHPLARFIDLDAKPKAPRWVIPGFIGHGVVIIAGAHGVGKTTALLPLAMVAAGLHAIDDELAPRHWRHVVYITEDTEQAGRILAGIVVHGKLGIDAGQVRERLHIVEARRLDPLLVAQVGKTYREQFARTVNGVEILPLVVIDTKAAVLALENENDNSEASNAMAALKQGFEGLPVWLIGHVAKQNLNRSNVSELSLRGGSAFEADANQVLYLVKEDEARYLVRGKTRFEARWQELQIRNEWAVTTAEDEFGVQEAITLRWGIAAPPAQTRKEAAAQAQEQVRKDDAAELRDEVRNVVELAWSSGLPLNRAGVKAKINRRTTEVVDCIENLLNERLLHEVEVPAKERVNNRRSTFLVNLSTPEHEAVLRGGELPSAKLEIPDAWKKPPISFVPNPERTDGKTADAPGSKS